MAQRCGVCASGERAVVDQQLRADRSAREIGEDLGISRFAVMRHRDNHLATPTAPHRTPSPPQGEPPQPLPKLNPSVDPKATFLARYAVDGDLKAALKAAGITRAQFRKWQEVDEEFLLRFRIAETEAIEGLETEARTRAVAGSMLVREVWRHGNLYETIKEWRPSDAMLIKLLQAHKPEKYGDRLTLTQTTVVKAVDAEAWNSV